jgi:hypothetical protein
VIVGGGVVLAASYEAKAYGIETAMGAPARRLCPDAIVVPPRMSAYAEASKAVYRIFDETTPLVEGLSIDEAFLDVRGMERIAGSPVEIAVRLRRRVLEEVGLPLTVGGRAHERSGAFGTAQLTGLHRIGEGPGPSFNPAGRPSSFRIATGPDRVAQRVVGHRPCSGGRCSAAILPERRTRMHATASSSGEEIPRGLEFLFSRNRLNVAISRARCLAYLVGSPRRSTSAAARSSRCGS